MQTFDSGLDNLNKTSLLLDDPGYCAKFLEKMKKCIDKRNL